MQEPHQHGPNCKHGHGGGLGGHSNGGVGHGGHRGHGGDGHGYGGAQMSTE